MRISLIDHTGFGHPDKNFAAKKLIMAKNTRLSKDDRVVMAQRLANASYDELLVELRSVVMTIRSSWEMVNFTFLVEDISRACCDQMTRSRVGVSFAVQAQRVVDKTGFDYAIPPTIVASPNALAAFENHMKATSTVYEFLRKIEIPAQDARAVLPMATHSPVTAEYNLRSLAGIVGKRRNLRAQGEYSEVAAEMARLVIDALPWTSMFLYPDRTRTPALDAILKNELGTGSPVDKPYLNDALKELDMLRGVWD